MVASLYHTGQNCGSYPCWRQCRAANSWLLWKLQIYAFASYCMTLLPPSLPPPLLPLSICQGTDCWCEFQGQEPSAGDGSSSSECTNSPLYRMDQNPLPPPRARTTPRSSCLPAPLSWTAKLCGSRAWNTTPSSGQYLAMSVPGCLPQLAPGYVGAGVSALTPPPPLPRTVKVDIVRRPSSGGLFRRGSSFRFSGRTQFRLLQDGSSSRRPSKRFERWVRPAMIRWSCDMFWPRPPQAEQPQPVCPEDHLMQRQGLFPLVLPFLLHQVMRTLIAIVFSPHS